ncbi:hypothetical protein [Gemmata obscuriglobus]|nr:hypothetical protein [Gemmata obscuriglobus]
MVTDARSEHKHPHKHFVTMMNLPEILLMRHPPWWMINPSWWMLQLA